MIRITAEKTVTFIKLCSILLAVVLVLLFLYVQGYRINLTDSLPYRIFKIRDVADKTISRGDYVVVNYMLIEDNPVIKTAVERKYLSRIPMVKQVGAVSGDLILMRESRLYINGENVGPMIIQSADSLGNPLSQFPTPVTLEAGQYWLVSNPDRGFDSRYFGWISRDSITHLTHPVF
jgi:conjugative transfer signal peptidase TraF